MRKTLFGVLVLVGLLGLFALASGTIKGKFLGSQAIAVSSAVTCNNNYFRCTDFNACIDTFFSNGKKLNNIIGSGTSANDNSRNNGMTPITYTIPDTYKTGDQIYLVYDARPCDPAGIVGGCSNWVSKRYIYLPITVGTNLSNSATPNSSIYQLFFYQGFPYRKSAWFYAQYDVAARKVTAHIEYHGDATDFSALSLELREIGQKGGCLSPLYSNMTQWAFPNGFLPRICANIENVCSPCPAGKIWNATSQQCEIQSICQIQVIEGTASPIIFPFATSKSIAIPNKGTLVFLPLGSGTYKFHYDTSAVGLSVGGKVSVIGGGIRSFNPNYVSGVQALEMPSPDSVSINASGELLYSLRANTFGGDIFSFDAVCCPAGKIWNATSLQCENVRICTQVVVCGLKNDIYSQYATPCAAEDAGAIIVNNSLCESQEGPCDGDSICDLDEGCACSDCAGNGDNCVAGLICRYNALDPIQSSCQPNCTLPQVWNGTACVTIQNGDCGTANGKNYTAATQGYGADTQCAAGTVSLTAFPQPGNTAHWMCWGINGGNSSVECSASREQAVIPFAVCGTAAQSYSWDILSFGNTTFCQSGSPIVTPSFPNPTQTVSWVCPGQTSDKNTTCQANRGQQPICGSNDSRGMPGDRYPFTTQEFPVGTGHCSVGTALTVPTFPAYGATVTWQCSTGNGPDADCRAEREVINCTAEQFWNGTACIPRVNGECGSANGKQYGPEDVGYGTYTQCTHGSASRTSFPGMGDTARWTCRGADGGDDSTECSATRIGGSGACGAATKTYDWDITSFGTDSFCQSGASTPSTPSFPDYGADVVWTCPGQNGGAAVPCSANRSRQPICGSNDSRDETGGKYSLSTLAFPIGTGYCAAGNAGTTPAFPAYGVRVTWQCSTGNGADVECRAERAGDIFCPANTTYVSTATTPTKCCTATEVTNNTSGCGGGVCDGDAVCDANEGCTCADCHNQVDHCAAGLVCSGTAPSAACCPINQTWNTITRSCETPVECPTTQAPETLRQSAGIPYIGCLATDKGTHFKYTLTGPSGYSYTSPVYPLASNPIQHIGTLIYAGRYEVRCFYGNTATQTTRGCGTDTADRTITVDPNAQLCLDAVVYKGGMPTYTSATGFNGSAVCLSDKPYESGTPFSVKIANSLWANLGLGASGALITLNPVFGTFSGPQPHDFPSGRTPVVCRVQSGNGYSTSAACQKSVCVGGNCALPQTFVVTQSGNTLCTTSTSLEYSIGCDTNGENPAVCKQRFENLFRGNSDTTKTTTIKGTVGGVPNQDITVTCRRTSITDARYDQISCSVRLDSGREVLISTGDYGGSSYQTISNIAARDAAAPLGTFVPQTGFTSANNRTFSSSTWLNHEVSAAIVCQNDPQNTDACTCRDIVPNAAWLTNGLLADTMTFTRTFREGIHTGTLKTRDTASNESDAMTVSLGIDMTPPTVSITVVNQHDPMFGTDRPYITVTATDSMSGIIDANHTFPAITANSTDVAFCNTALGNFPGTSSPTRSVGFSAPGVGEKVAYCFRDGAGNITRGEYPENAVTYYGCFADGTIPPVPNLTTYAAGLMANITSARFGYSLSDSTQGTQNTLFHTNLDRNINTLITQQYEIKTIGLGSADSVNFAPGGTLPANLPNDLPNSNGYYWYGLSGGALLKISGAEITSPKVLLVDGSDIRIEGNITYQSGTNASLVIIARKAADGSGGNIYIDPSVTNISATLIADGALMNYGIHNLGNLATFNWLDATDRPQLNKKLTINGRLLTHNTRGGSLIVTGGRLQALPDDINNPRKPMCYSSATQSIAPCVRSDAAAQDLERFRLTTTAPTSNEQCTLYVTGTTPRLLPILSDLTL